MDNGIKIILIAVSIVLAATAIGYAMSPAKKGTNLASAGMNQLDAQTAALVNMDKELYNNSSMTGGDVIDCINKYKDTTIYVIVNTRDGAAYVYNNEFNPDLSDASAIAEDFKVANSVFWELGGWPVNCWGSDLQPHQIESKLADGADAAATPRFGSLEAAPKGIYDATSTSNTKGYLSRNASFASTIQIDKNNDVRSITFVQK